MTVRSDGLAEPVNQSTFATTPVKPASTASIVKNGLLFEFPNISNAVLPVGSVGKLIIILVPDSVVFFIQLIQFDLSALFVFNSLPE